MVKKLDAHNATAICMKNIDVDVCAFFCLDKYKVKIGEP